MEGEEASAPRALDFARRDAVTCRLDAIMSEVRGRVADSPYGFAFVTMADGVLLGRLRKAVLDGDPVANAAHVMEPGPSTTRPDTPPDKLLAKLQRAELKTAVLSDPEGRLLGRRSTRGSTGKLKVSPAAAPGTSVGLSTPGRACSVGCRFEATSGTAQPVPVWTPGVGGLNHPGSHPRLLHLGAAGAPEMTGAVPINAQRAACVPEAP